MLRHLGRLLSAAAFIAALPPPTIAQDTPQCLAYYDYAARAGDLSTYPELQRRYAECLASRQGGTGDVGNPYCSCPVGSRCVDGGNRCEPLGNGSDECGPGWVRDVDGSCIDRSAQGAGDE